MDRRRALGIGLVVVAGASFASGSIFATLSYGEGLDWLTLLGWRFLIGAGLAWAWVALSSSRRASVRALSRRQLAVTLALGAVYTGNAGTYYAGIETIPASLAGVIVYIYPVFVALLSLRFATRLPGRRPWFALVLAVVGIVLALGGIDVSADLPDRGHPPDPCVGGDLLGLDRPVRAPVGRAARPTRERRARRRHRGQGRRRHDRGDDDARRPSCSP